MGKPAAVSPTISCVTPGGKGAPGSRRFASPRSMRPRTNAVEASSVGTISVSFLGGSIFLPFHLVRQAAIEKTTMQPDRAVVGDEVMTPEPATVVQTSLGAPQSRVIDPATTEQIVHKSVRCSG